MRCPVCGRPLIVKDGAKRKLRTRIVIFSNGRAFAKCQYCKSDVEVPVFIDEVADLMDQGGNAMERLLARLTQRGRGAGIHLIACTQKPLAASIGSVTRSNFPIRLVGSVTSPEDEK